MNIGGKEAGSHFFVYKYIESVKQILKKCQSITKQQQNLLAPPTKLTIIKQKH